MTWKHSMLAAVLFFVIYIYFCVLSIFISPFLLLLSASEKCLSSMWILNYFWMKNCVFDFVFLLENFLFINLLLHVNLLIVDGFPSINKQISTFKKKNILTISLKNSAPNATFGFTVYRKMIFHVAIEVTNVFGTCWRGRGCWIWSI